MAYIVQGMTLIPQQLNMSCWYASATMLIQWKMDQRQQSIGGLIPPELDAECQKIKDDNKGIANPQIVKMAKRLGLEAIPPMTPTVETIEGWLKQYGPLWVNGKTHIVVIAGIMYFPGLGYMFLVYNPAPVGVGKIEWKSLTDWYLSGNSSSSRDTAKSVEAVFLYVPDSI
jgi:hypothetical protein